MPELVTTSKNIKGIVLNLIINEILPVVNFFLERHFG